MRKLSGQIQLTTLWTMKGMAFSAMGTYLRLLGVSKGGRDRMQCFWNFLDNPYQQLKSALLMLLLRFLLDDLWLLKGALSAQMGNFHLTYIHMFIYQLMCIIDIFRRIVNSMVLHDFFRQPYYYFTPITPYSIFIFLPLFN